jgi:RNA polymerase sigma-70 factor (ECF subfamily)
MGECSPSDVTRLLVEWQDGQPGALERLVPLVYAELRRLAHGQMARERAGHTLQTTALVHETYLRLVDGAQVSWKDRAHFFAVCARLMRRILIDAARERLAAKRGGSLTHVAYEEWAVGRPATDEQLIAVNELLARLTESDPRKAQIIELRFFGGLTVDETAAALGVSSETVGREWKLARMWLQHELSDQNPRTPNGQ